MRRCHVLCCLLGRLHCRDTCFDSCGPLPVTSATFSRVVQRSCHGNHLCDLCLAQNRQHCRLRPSAKPCARRTQHDVRRMHPKRDRHSTRSARRWFPPYRATKLVAPRGKQRKNLPRLPDGPESARRELGSGGSWRGSSPALPPLWPERFWRRQFPLAGWPDGALRERHNRRHGSVAWMFAIIWTYFSPHEDMSYRFLFSVTHENCACDIYHSFAFALRETVAVLLCRVDNFA